MLDKSLIDRKIHSAAMEMCFNAVVTEAFVGALPIPESELTDDLTQSFASYACECLKDLGSVSLLTEAIESMQEPMKKAYLKKIYDICNESATTITARIIDENPNDEELKDAADRVAMTPEEYARFSKAASEVTPESLSKMIQKKTLDTIKAEKEAYTRDAELEEEITAALNEAEDKGDEPDPAGAPVSMTQPEAGAATGEAIGTEATEGFKHNIKQTDEYKQYRSMRSNYRQAKRAVKDGKYDDAEKALEDAIGASYALRTKCDDVEDTSVLERIIGFIVSMETLGFGFIGTGTSLSKQRFLEKLNKFIKKCEKLKGDCAAKRAKESDFEGDDIHCDLNDNSEPTPASESDSGHYVDVNNDKAAGVNKIDTKENSSIEADEVRKDKIELDAEKTAEQNEKHMVGENGMVFESWQDALDTYEAANEGIIRTLWRDHQAYKKTPPQFMSYTADKPLGDLMDLYEKGCRFISGSTISTKYPNEFQRAFEMLKGVGMKVVKTTLGRFDAIVLSEPFTVPKDEAILNLLHDPNWSLVPFIDAGEQVSTDSIWLPTEDKHGKWYGTLHSSATDIKTTAAYAMWMIEKGKIKGEAIDLNGGATESEGAEYTDGNSDHFIELATDDDPAGDPVGAEIGRELQNEDKPDPIKNDAKAMESYNNFLAQIAGIHNRPNHASVFSRLQELSYEAIRGTMESFTDIPFETMTAVTKENTFKKFHSNSNKSAVARMNSVARYAFESAATPDGPEIVHQQLDQALLMSSIIYTFFETLNTMNLYSPKLNEIRDFVDETLPIKDRVEVDKRGLEEAIRGIIADVEARGNHAKVVPDVDLARKDLDIVREKMNAPGFESIRANVLTMIDKANESMGKHRDKLIDAQRPVQPVMESSTALMKRERDTLKFSRIANTMGRKPNITTVRCKVDPQKGSQYIAVEGYDMRGNIAGKNTVVLEGAYESDLVGYVRNAVEASALMNIDKKIIISDCRNSKVYMDSSLK